MILAGDVGGTKTQLGLYRADGSGRNLALVREASFPSHEHRSLEQIIERFLGGRSRVSVAVMGVAGPVVDGRSQVVNLPWVVDGRKLCAAFRCDEVRILNDLEAGAWAVGRMGPRNEVPLTGSLKGRPGNGAVIAAGTGLGMALLFWDGERHHPSAGEGGHQGFAPRDPEEVELLRFAQEEFDGRVSVERLLSGPGFHTIYRFLTGTGRFRETAAMRRRLASSSDPNAEISRAGLAGEDRASRRALEMFVSIYGSAAGDLALVSRAVAGVWLMGGIAPKILPALRSPGFLQAFRDKGRLSPLVEKIPVRVVLEPRAPQIGAAACAARILERG